MATKEAEILAATEPGQEVDPELLARVAAARARRAKLTVGLVESFARGGAAGALFEFDDEISAGIRSLSSLAPGGETPGEAFRSNVGEVRARKTAAREAHRWAFGLGTIAGAAVTTGGAGAVIRGGGAVTAKLTLRQLAKIGAAEGAVTGAGVSEGGLVERAKGGAVGGAVGAVAAPVVTGVGRGLGKVGTRVLDVTGLRPSETGGAVSRLAGRVFDTVEERASQRLAAALPEGKDLARAVDQLGPIDPPRSSIETRMRSGTDRPLTIMDIDENVAGVARAARGVQGRAKTELPRFLSERVAGQEKRVLDDAFRLTGAADQPRTTTIPGPTIGPEVRLDPELGLPLVRPGERGSIFETTQEIITRRSKLASPLYEAAYEQSVPREVLGDVFDDDVFRKAYERGVRIAKREGVDLSPIGELLPEGGGMIGPQEIPVQAIDFMKRGLDDLIEVGSRSSKGMGRQEARGIRNKLRDMLVSVDEVVPDYAEARSVFAGESKMLEALEQGQRLFQLEPAEAESIINALPNSEREMFIRGAFEKLAEKVEGASASFDITKRAPLANRTRDRQRLRLLFPSDEVFAEFQRGLADEATIARTNRFVTGGSNTAEKIAEMMELGAGGVTAMMTGNVGSVAARFAQGALRRRTQGFTSGLGEAMLPTLKSTGADAAEAIRHLTNLRQGVGAQLSRREAVEAGVAGVAAASEAARPRDGAEARASELREQGLSDDEVIAQLKAEKLIDG
jgi:hypothetical protein